MKSSLTFIIFLASCVNCANILGYFPTASISHQVVYHAIIKDLADRGHTITVLTPDLIKTSNPNISQIDLHDSYEIFRTAFNFVEYKMKSSDDADLLSTFFNSIELFYDYQLSKPEVQKIIRRENDQKFDLILIEHLYYTSLLAFGEIYDCPVVGITSLDSFIHTHEDIGNTANPVIHPDIVLPFLPGTLSFGERWRSIKYYFKSKFYWKPKYDELHENLLRKHMPMVKTPLEQLKNRLQLLMTNTSPAMGFLRPILPNTIQLGFMHIEPPRPLAEGKLKDFLDNSKNGVIYMSFGSNVQSKDLGPEILKNFLRVFGSLNLNVLWKFEADDLPNKPDNVMITKWTPQSDLLAHPKIKIFITQGGQQSMEEAIDRQVPMIVIPFLGDQGSNANRIVSKGVGYRLDLETLTEVKLMGAINEMLKPKYKENIRKLRELVYDQPMTSRERAVWWIEYVIRHKGAKHLEYPGRKVPFYQKYWLDFIGIFVFIVFVAFVVVKFILKALVGQLQKEKEE